MPKSNIPLSRKAFRGLMSVLPGDFRANFGGGMEQAFEEQKRDLERRGGIMDFARLWGGKHWPASSGQRPASTGKS
jgi:hypothetical protein